MTPEERLVALETHLEHIRADIGDIKTAITRLTSDFKGLMWKVVGIGTAAGAVGTAVALFVAKAVV